MGLQGDNDIADDGYQENQRRSGDQRRLETQPQPDQARGDGENTKYERGDQCEGVAVRLLWVMALESATWSTPGAGM